MYKKYFKKNFDLIFSLLLLIITSPLLICFSILLFFLNNGKVFYIQPRPGRDEKIIYIYKFRTMNDKRNKNGDLLSDNERISYIGRFLRNSSIDKLPQLINVLKGDISFIGPRPLLIEYLPLYNAIQHRRHEVKPGITGWAQVNGRNAISWNEKFTLDVWYVENISFCLDVKILALTFIKVLKSDGVNASNSSTMEAFKGNF